MEQAVKMDTDRTIRHGYWAMFQSGRISAQDVRKKFGISDYDDINEWFEKQDRKDSGYVLVRRDDLEHALEDWREAVELISDRPWEEAWWTPDDQDVYTRLRDALSTE